MVEKKITKVESSPAPLAAPPEAVVESTNIVETESTAIVEDNQVKTESADNTS